MNTQTEAPSLLANPDGVFAQVEKMGHELVTYCYDQPTGLKAIIAVHNSVLGPGMGGTRMWPYATEAEALTDVLRLARGMTLKNSVAGLNLGGGKAVIIGDPRRVKTEALLRLYGKCIQNLNGKYVTAEDVGMTDHDMETIALQTRHVSGLPLYRGGSGSPAVMTGYGVYVGMKAAAKRAFGTDSLANRKVAVQGAGAVSQNLVPLLLKEGATVFVSDVFEDKLKAFVANFGGQAVPADQIYDLDVDIYSPNALGATINDDTLGRLKCQVIAGAANNQLANEPKHGLACLERGLVYAPDFVINGGGVTNIATEIAGQYNAAWAKAQTEQIYDRVGQVVDQAQAQRRNAQEVATEMALARIKAVAHVKTMY
ncbi:MAG: leucine dehydrogenase [Bernardetiaceae bacterium]|jgi:leucine dehydrogenase|nr:leucine dehydrogenase [Bernardetiaceae bacterium]